MGDCFFEFNSTVIGIEQKIVIYGAGKLGKYALRFLKKNGRNNIVAFIDKNANELVPFLFNIPIYPTNKIIDFYDCVFVVAAEKKSVCKQMMATLLKYGIPNDKILCCEKKVVSNQNVIPQVAKFLDRTLCNGDKRIFIFMLPEHGNTGDYLIGYSEMEFFREYFPEYVVYGVTTSEWISLKDIYTNIIKISDLICINGGGFFGDLRGDDVVYKDIVESFPQNHKFFMPNTLTYCSTPCDSNQSFIEDVNWIKSQKKLHIFLREKNSYNALRRYLDNCSLTPDMALQFSCHNSVYDSSKMLLCMRKDCERIFDSQERLQNILEENNIEYDEFDIYLKQFISQEDGKDLIRYVVDKFQQYKCIITDRLHAMLISAICEVPCLAFDNFTFKVSGVYEWIKECEYIKIITEDDIFKFIEYIEMVSDSNIKRTYSPPLDEFERMAQVIRENIL